MSVVFLGTTDEVSTCDCCGRQGLKSTVALQIDAAEPVYYGVVCASRALKQPAKTIRAAAKSADEAKATAERARINAEQAAKDAQFGDWLRDKTGLTERFAQLEALGGMPKARALYNAR